MRNVILLGEVAQRTAKLEVVCRKCDRRGVLSTARLVQEYGSGMPMPQLRCVPAGNCERLKAGKVHDPCGCHFRLANRTTSEIYACKHNPLYGGQRRGCFG
jgi:hypothetical protein